MNNEIRKDEKKTKRKKWEVMHTDVCPWSASFTQKIPRPIDNCKYGEYALVFYIHTLASYRTTYLKSQPFHFQFLVVKKRIRRSK